MEQKGLQAAMYAPASAAAEPSEPISESPVDMSPVAEYLQKENDQAERDSLDWDLESLLSDSAIQALPMTTEEWGSLFNTSLPKGVEKNMETQVMAPPKIA